MTDLNSPVTYVSTRQNLSGAELKHQWRKWNHSKVSFSNYLRNTIWILVTGCWSRINRGHRCQCFCLIKREFAKHLHLDLEFDNTNITHLMSQEDKKEMDAVCDVKVKLWIGNSAIDWPIYICPSRDNVLIGMDLLEAFDAIDLARQGDMVINGIPL